MPNHDCAATRKLAGVFQCDLSRTDNEHSKYSARFRVAICVERGHAELYGDPHAAVCEWLEGESGTPKPRVN